MRCLKSAFDDRYGKGIGKKLINAYNLASKMPLRLASFHKATWDYTLYSEGFLAPFAPPAGLYDKVSSFISIDELIDHPTLDSRYISISDYVQHLLSKTEIKDVTTPLQLADSLEADGDQVLKMTKTLRSNATRALLCELDDLDTWAYLSKYFARKLRAGIALHTFRMSNDKPEQEKAVQLLSDCLNYWKKISEITKGHYNEVPYLDDQSTANNPQNDGKTFSWSKYLPQVERDIEIAKEAKAN